MEHSPGAETGPSVWACANTLTGTLVVDQPESFADLGDAVIQDHAVEAVRRFTGA
ncbi:hypothetical protein P3T23_001965 [Paraburkholderia sp. GAS448]